jgi:hypothetical protein
MDTLVIKALLEGLDEDTRVKVLVGVIEKLLTKETTPPVATATKTTKPRRIRWKTLGKEGKLNFLRQVSRSGGTFAQAAKDSKARYSTLTAFAKRNGISTARKPTRALSLSPEQVAQFEIQ